MSVFTSETGINILYSGNISYFRESRSFKRMFIASISSTEHLPVFLTKRFLERATI
ncbi:hypothetical protein L6E24_13355 [Methanoplanus endosymbiosus]|uniref:Uncharacterized protein n=1 Tax=Methanoplanus endosymbiosus TaxID=33865 RepID=A0A9E7TH61_9EURY|nr:hypothetical protein [Methanoplanus endosymbiosus]UUX92307.1 hypothetical protein L6E24_13355 [Methanoplanus endosymbiosus]